MYNKNHINTIWFNKFIMDIWLRLLNITLSFSCFIISYFILNIYVCLNFKFSFCLSIVKICSIFYRKVHSKQVTQVPPKCGVYLINGLSIRFITCIRSLRCIRSIRSGRAGMIFPTINIFKSTTYNWPPIFLKFAWFCKNFDTKFSCFFLKLRWIVSNLSAFPQV